MNVRRSVTVQVCERCGTYTTVGMACACWPDPPTLTGGRGLEEQDWATWLAVLGYLQKRYGSARMVSVLRLEARRLEGEHDREQTMKGCRHLSRARVGPVEDERWVCNDCGYDNAEADWEGTPE